MTINLRHSLDKRSLVRAALLSLAFFFAAHAFCFFNLTYSGPSVMLDVSRGRSALLAQGRFLAPYYFRLRGALSAPMLVGMLCALYLAITSAAVSWLLRLEKPLHQFILCGALTANAAMTALFAGSLNTADAACLALLLAALAACCLRMRLGALPGAALLAAAMALDPASAAFFASLTVAAAVSQLLLSRSATSLLRALCALPAGAALWYAGCLLFARRSGAAFALPIALPEGGLAGAWLASLRALLSPLTAYARLNTVLHGLLLALCALSPVPVYKRLDLRAALITGVCVLLMPLLISPALWGEQVIPALSMIDILFLVLLARLFPEKARILRAAACALGALFLGCVVFSNQVYLKKNLEFESAISLTSRIIQRAEETPGYQPGFTPVAVIGTMEDSIYAVPRKGFEHLSALEAARANTAVTTGEEMIWYCWEILGYPFNFVSTFELEQINAHSAVQSMPAFPAQGCCALVDGVLVIKLN